MNLCHKLVAVTAVLVLATFCSGQERFQSGWLKGFTKSPTEHIIDERDEPFTVRSVEGVVLDPSGAVMPDVLVEIQDAGGRIRAAKTSSKGTFKVGGIASGSYRFKVTMNGFQSVVGEVIVSRKADKSQHINISMKAGV